MDGSGNVFIAEPAYNTIKEWNASTQQLSTLVSKGLDAPSGVAVDGSGNVLIADTYNNAIEEWNASTQELFTLIPGAGQWHPESLSVDGSGNLYILSPEFSELVEWSASTHQVVFLDGEINGPVAVDVLGDVYIADDFNNRVQEVNVSTHRAPPWSLGWTRPAWRWTVRATFI